MWDFITEHLGKLLIGLNYLLALGAAFTIVLRNVNPIRTVSYVLALLFVPFLGLIFYIFFGQEYRRTRMFKRKNLLNQSNVKKWQQSLVLDQQALHDFEEEVLLDKAKLIRLLHDKEQSPLTLHNEVEILINGEEKFRCLFEDVRNAQSSIHLEYYILRDDKIGSELIDLLCERAEAGVEVRINFDYVGSSLSNKTRARFKKHGIEFFPFLPVHFPRFTSKLNHRNHRKIAIIDGRIGYVGGINIGDEYLNAHGKRYWRDSHLRLKGESVGVLQLHFLLNWDFVSEQDFEIKEEWFPRHEITRETAVQIAVSGPDTDWANIMEALFVGINSATDHLYLTTPYFIPNDEIFTSLIAASRSGVDVKVLIPGQSDSWAAKYASFSYIERMLRAGVEVHLYEKGIIHAKTMVVDGVFSTIGTSNMDYRSFNTNFEINALIYNKKVAAQMENTFFNDLQESRLLDAEEWYNRPFKQKLKESFCRLWAPLL